MLERANKYILPVYARPPFILSHGKGAYVWDTEGRKYLDFSAGIAVNALGHADEGLVEVRVLIISPSAHLALSRYSLYMLSRLQSNQDFCGSALTRNFIASHTWINQSADICHYSCPAPITWGVCDVYRY